MTSRFEMTFAEKIPIKAKDTILLENKDAFWPFLSDLDRKFCSECCKVPFKI